MMDYYPADQLDVASRGSGSVVGTARQGTQVVREHALCGRFEGVNAFLDFVADNMAEAREERASASTDRDGFHTFCTYDEAMRTYRHDPAKVRNFTEADLELSDEDAAGRAVLHDVTGDFLDIGRYLEGEPECFGVMSDGNPRARRVNLLVNVSWPGMVGADVVNARGQRIQRLVDWLESRSVRTAITALASNECAHLEVLVKSHDEALDMNDLAVISHGDFLRRIVFRFREYSRTFEQGYGNPRYLNQALAVMDLAPDYSNEMTVVISNNVSDRRPLEAKFDEVEKLLAGRLSSSVLDPEEAVVKMFVGASW